MTVIHTILFALLVGIIARMIGPGRASGGMGVAVLIAVAGTMLRHLSEKP